MYAEIRNSGRSKIGVAAEKHKRRVETSLQVNLLERDAVKLRGDGESVRGIREVRRNPSRRLRLQGEIRLASYAVRYQAKSRDRLAELEYKHLSIYRRIPVERERPVGHLVDRAGIETLKRGNGDVYRKTRDTADRKRHCKSSRRPRTFALCGEIWRQGHSRQIDVSIGTQARVTEEVRGGVLRVGRNREKKQKEQSEPSKAFHHRFC